MHGVINSRVGILFPPKLQSAVLEGIIAGGGALKCHRLFSLVSTPWPPVGWLKCKEFSGRAQPAAPISSGGSRLQVFYPTAVIS